MKIGTEIKKHRKNLNITQRELASKIDIPYSTLANYENNHREPNLETIAKIASVLNVDVAILLDPYSPECNKIENNYLKSTIDNLSSHGDPYIQDFISCLSLSCEDLSRELDNNINNKAAYDDICVNSIYISHSISALSDFLTLPRDEATNALNEIEEFIRFKYEKLKNQRR